MHQPVDTPERKPLRPGCFISGLGLDLRIPAPEPRSAWEASFLVENYPHPTKDDYLQAAIVGVFEEYVRRSDKVPNTREWYSRIAADISRHLRGYADEFGDPELARVHVTVDKHYHHDIRYQWDLIIEAFGRAVLVNCTHNPWRRTPP